MSSGLNVLIKLLLCYLDVLCIIGGLYVAICSLLMSCRREMPIYVKVEMLILESRINYFN